MKTLSFDKIKQHREKSDVHKEAEDQELTISDGRQPNWCTAQQKQISKHQQAIQTLMALVISICQEDAALNTLESRCRALEKVGVTLLPAETTNVNYRNNDAALVFAQTIASCLHEELVAKVKASPVVGM